MAGIPQKDPFARNNFTGGQKSTTPMVLGG